MNTSMMFMSTTEEFLEPDIKNFMGIKKSLGILAMIDTSNKLKYL